MFESWFVVSDLQSDTYYYHDLWYVLLLSSCRNSELFGYNSGGEKNLNTLNIGSNKRNVTNLSDWISNQDYRLCNAAELFL